MSRSLICTLYAPMCCVIPPASVLVTLACLIVEQRGLAVVNVTHYNNDRITRLKALGIVGSILEQTLLDGNDNFLLDLCA